MTVALCVLAMGEEALRDDEVEIVLGARHGDIEEAQRRAGPIETAKA